MADEGRRPDPLAARWSPVRLAFLALGFGALALGIIGIVVPLLPTTPFLILAAAAFARSSPRLEAWLLAHPRLGPGLRAWRARRAIPRPAKWASALGMGAGYGIFLATSSPPMPLALGVALAFAAISAWIWTRPE